MASQDSPAAPVKPLKLQRVAGLTIAGVRAAVASGARFVIFPYCESFAVVTFRRVTDPILVRAGESRLRVSGAPILHSLLLGWWGLPWGRSGRSPACGARSAAGST